MKMTGNGIPKLTLDMGMVFPNFVTSVSDNLEYRHKSHSRPKYSNSVPLCLRLRSDFLT